MPDSPAPLARLKRRLQRLERPRHMAAGRFALGCIETDARLEGGLARGALHEICAAGDGDHWAASGFALMLALRAAPGRPLLWVSEDKGERRQGALYGPGLAWLGADPGQIVRVIAPDTVAVLRAAADILGVLGGFAAVIEPAGEARALDLTASRRLALAAEKSGSVALVLRESAAPFASAAATRWCAGAAPSVPLPAQAPGHPAFALELVRHRGGVPPFATVLEWNRDEQAFRKPPLSRDLLPAAERGQMAA